MSVSVGTWQKRTWLLAPSSWCCCAAAAAGSRALSRGQGSTASIKRSGKCFCAWHHSHHCTPVLAPAARYSKTTRLRDCSTHELLAYQTRMLEDGNALNTGDPTCHVILLLLTCILEYEDKLLLAVYFNTSSLHARPLLLRLSEDASMRSCLVF